MIVHQMPNLNINIIHIIHQHLMRLLNELFVCLDNFLDFCSTASKGQARRMIPLARYREGLHFFNVYHIYCYWSFRLKHPK